MTAVEIEVVELYRCAWTRVVLAHGYRSTKTKTIGGRYNVAHRDGCTRAQSWEGEQGTQVLTLLGPVPITDVDPLTACAWCLSDVANPTPVEALGDVPASTVAAEPTDVASEHLDDLATALVGARPGKPRTTKGLKVLDRPNMYAGRCARCNSTVASHSGFLAQRTTDGAWAVIHRAGECNEKKSRRKGT